MPWESRVWHRLTAGYRLMRLVPPVRLCARFGGQSVHRPAAFMSTDQRHRTGAPVLGGGSELVRVDVTAGVATMTLSDNKKRNALSSAMMSALRTVLAELEQDAAVKVGVIRHEGTVFSSGHDLKEISLQQLTAGTTEPFFSLCSSLMLSVQEARFPVFAEVGGLATAGGCSLPPAIWPWRPSRQHSRHLASKSDSSARRLARLSCAQCQSSTQWRCCSLVTR